MDRVQSLVKVAETVRRGASAEWEGSFKEEMNLNHSESYFIDNKVAAYSDFRLVKVESNAMQSVLVGLWLK